MFDTNANIIKIQYIYNVVTIIMDTYYTFLVYLDTEPCMQTW